MKPNQWLARALLWGSLGIGTGSAHAETFPEKVYTSNSAFRMPIEMDARDRQSIQAIKLYVRTPESGWTCVETAPASQTAFRYQAPTDGEYWIQFVTVGLDGIEYPDDIDSLPPNVVVVVDSIPPVVELKPVEAVNGDTYLHCRVVDTDPRAASLHVRYADAQGRWVDLVPLSRDNPSVFRVPEGVPVSSPFQVSASDRAGNEATQFVHASATPSDAPPTLPVSPTEYSSLAPPPPLPQPEPESLDPSIALTSTAIPIETGPSLPEVPMVEAETPAIVPIPLPELSELPSIPQVPTLVPAPEPEEEIAPPPGLPVEEAIVPPAALPEDEHLPILNTTRFSVDYAIEDFRLTALTRVEFWYTADHGKTWHPLGDDSDRRSPAHLALPGDGQYGIVAKIGSNRQSPAPGEEAEFWIEIDTSAPVVSLLPPTVEHASTGIALTIPWTATDRNLTSEPIRLQYASTPTGPWMDIAAGLKNEGIHRWSPPAGVGSQVYLRVEATDQAGNVAAYVTPTPVVLTKTDPRIRLHGVAPSQMPIVP